MRKYYEEQLNNLQKLALKQKKEVNLYSLWRLIVFVLLIGSISIALIDQKRYLLLVAIICLVIFFYLLKKHNDAINKQKFIKTKIKVIHQYLARFDFKWQNFTETGQEYLQDSDFKALDLNLLGPNSLFQYLNLAKSSNGQALLAQRLTNNQDYSQDSPYIQALAKDKDLHLNLSTQVQLYNKNAKLDFNEKPILSKGMLAFYNIIGKVLAPISLLFYILIIFNFINIKYLGLLILINILIFMIGFKKNSTILKTGNLNSNIEVLKNVMVILENNSNHLIHNKFPNINSKALKELIKINERISSSSNILMYFIANITIMWDYQNVYAYEKFKMNNHENINSYPTFFYELEVLLSLGVIQQTKETYCTPTISNENEPELVVEGLYHPLLDNKVVANDFETKSNTIMITGSNMSGKTTFMRSIGINVILAYTGAMVCAQKLKVSYLEVLTSIRVQDDLNEGISSFYAEIKRVKTMIEFSKQEKPALFLIDEIFKGTNSDDRIYGATKVIENLSKKWIISIISTHDSELTMLKVENYHFKEYYDNNSIKFDYLINEGPAKTKNAKYLLKMAGII